MLRKDCGRFKNIKRHNLQNVVLHDQAGDVNPAAIADGLTHLKNTMKNYEMDCIYNVDETGLISVFCHRRHISVL